jgi:exosortase/archaeosortase family protein
MNRENLEIFFRYSIIFIFALIGLKLIYYIFLPLTLYPVYFLLGLIFNVSISKDIIYIGMQPIQIIGACVAASAYYFLIILNLATKKIKIKKRIETIFVSMLILLLVNITRIFILSLMFVLDSPYFEITHKIFWYFLSTIFVVLIWFFVVKVYGLKEIPFYSDIKYFYKKSLFGKTRKK